MLILSIITYSINIRKNKKVTSNHYTRVSQIVFIMCISLTIIINIDKIILYHTLFTYNISNYIIDNLLFITGIILLFFNNYKRNYNNNNNNYNNNNNENKKEIRKEYSFLIIFVIFGSTIIISSYDLISIYLSLEIQSFGLYIITCIYCNIESTRASFKYFLLGAISSSFILLGISIIYTTIGTTQFNEISDLIIYNNNNKNIIIGIISLISGFIFKISAVPFHNWAIDVYNDVETPITISLITLPKIGLIIFIGQFFIIIENEIISSFIIIIGIFSIIIGSVQGLSQNKIKKLITYSTISHVGFILLGLSICYTNNSWIGINAFIFYIIQYILTTLLTFITIYIYEITYIKNNINYIEDFIKISNNYKILAFTFVITLFSIAGIPPLWGFYAKINILISLTSENNNIIIIYIIAIISSIISASYYIKIIKIIIYNQEINNNLNNNIQIIYSIKISKSYCYIISIIIIFITIFIFDPYLILNSSELATLIYINI